jgi:hypothetical protein
MSNIEELRKLTEYGITQDSLLALNQTVLDSSALDSSRVEVDVLDSLEGIENKDSFALTQFSELPTLPGLVRNRPLDLFFRGMILSGESQRLVAKQHIEFGKIAAEKIGEGITGAGEIIQEHGVDYRNAIAANTLGAPVDVTNALLSLLGIEMSDRPFMGSKNIKKALDALSGISYSERYLDK